MNKGIAILFCQLGCIRTSFVVYISVENYFCTIALGTVDLPVSLKTVYENAFNGCSSLTRVIYDGTFADFESTVTMGSGNDALELAAYESLVEN